MLEQWSEKFNEVPTAKRANEEIIKKLSFADRLTPFSDYGLIADYVQRYPVYTHNAVFQMETGVIYSDMLYHYEKDMLRLRDAAIDREINKPKSKK